MNLVTIILVMIMIALIAFSTPISEGLAYTYSNDAKEMIYYMIPIVAICYLLDGLRAHLEGVIKAVGLQDKGAILTFVSVYLILLPLAVYFAFIAELGLIGFWIGSACGLSI